ncbi:starch synthase [Halanaerobium saccharolyticum]|uniref:Glycogen synthase n=1 Tax=Halanaerobium saccharolyticum TaxID=43595 RepID=A0A4R7YZ75_9FIRM|nr:glycogen synthase GlgA [Halanaerobium saccharolyticum]RAK08452.1 starch synthase [Halanaerobium saccharolyticum]TDW03513.1 starch synthase [Halanaerobium saccharolyticum]TDX59944.1 starch synthase [Halanaerobium saccharolyticum]
MNNEKKKILFVASEADPFIKTGGLADVAGSLPQALRDEGYDVRLVIPQYRQIPQKYYKDRMEAVCHFRTKLGWRDTYLGVNRLEEDGVPVYFIDNKYYFDRDSIYENEDKHEQFAFFSQAVLDMLPVIGFKPDIIHANDWQSGPLPLLFADRYRQQSYYQDIKTVFTIHNLRYQGQFAGHVAGDVLGVAPHHWESGNIRHNGLLNYMKSGIVYADHVTTVSESYANEIQTSYFGEGLDYSLRMRGDDLTGILNGISYDKFDPETNKNLAVRFSKGETDKKIANKVHIQQKLGLEVNGDKPLIGFISRMVEQKGLDLIQGVFDEIMATGAQFLILGTGQREYEEFLEAKQHQYPDNLSVNIKYDAQLADQIYAGVDMFLMPSRFEPCGLSQLISFRYGTIPIVRETGGLNDTVVPYNEETGEGTGFSFSDYNAHDMLHTIERAVSFYDQKGVWNKLVNRVMNLDYSWHHSAKEYSELYQQLTAEEDEQQEVQQVTPPSVKIKVYQPDSKAAGAEEKKPEQPETAKKVKSKKQDLVNINQASVSELAELPGIGNAYAERIAAFREKNGEFKKKSELIRVKGIGKKKYQKISNLLTI